MPTPLNKEDFYQWTIDDRDFKNRVLDHIETQAQLNRVSGERFATLEAKQAECAHDASKQSLWISTVVSAVITGLFTALSSVLGSRP